MVSFCPQKSEEEQIIGKEKIKRIFKFKDQAIAEIMDWNGNVYLKPPKTIRNWTEEQIEEEIFINSILVKTNNYGYNGKTGYKIEYFEDRKRLKITNGKGEIILDETKVINSWEIKTEMVFIHSKCYKEKIHFTNQGRAVIEGTIKLVKNFFIFIVKVKETYLSIIKKSMVIGK